MGRWNNNKLLDWVAAEQGKHICKCGCGEPLKIIPDHRKRGIPLYIHGHNSKGMNNPAFKDVGAWVKARQENIPCHCGCGEFVFIQSHHYYAGVPKYIHGHNSKGEGNANWKDGGSALYDKRRASAGIRRWRSEICERDGYRCQMPGCPNPENSNLHVHHIIGFTKKEDLKFELWNGIALCAPCHFSVKGREENFEEFFFTLLGKRGIRGCAK